MRRISPFLILPIVLVLLPHTGRGETGFLNRSITSGGETYRYVVFVPGGWTAGRKWPAILSLHGSIERGDDGMSQSRVALGKALRRFPERFPAIVIMPQCRPNVDWRTPAMQAQALVALESTLKEFNGDPQRVYLAGLSMGGYGTWSLAAKYPRRFAALVVICGGIQGPQGVAVKPLASGKDNPYARTARAIAHIPVWVFHGDLDKNVPVTESRRMVEALNALGANVKYTEYKGVAHECWDQAYSEPQLPAWLFAQHIGNMDAR